MRTFLGISAFIAAWSLAENLPTILPVWLQGILIFGALFSIPVAGLIWIYKRAR